MSDPQQRAEFARILGEERGTTVDLRGVSMREDCVVIAQAAFGRGGGIERLVDTVRLFAGYESAERFRARIAEGSPGEDRPVPLAPTFRDANTRRAHELLDRVIEIDLRALRWQLACDLDRIIADQPTLVALFDSLLELAAQPDGLPPALLLVERVAERDFPPLSGHLRRWTEAQARELGVLDALERRREEHAHDTTGPLDIPQCLVIMIDPVLDGSADIAVRYWVNPYPGRWAPRLGDDERATDETLDTVVERIILRTASTWEAEPKDPEVHVEFLLPYALLNHDLAWIRQQAGLLEAVAIGARYCVHVRSLERMRVRDGLLRQRWKERWRLLATSSAPLYPEEPPEKWGGVLSRNTCLTAVVLSQPALPGGGLEAIKAAIAQGVGLALWDRSGHYPAPTRDILMVLSSNVPRLLPKQIRFLRNRAAAQGDESGGAMRHVVCLWDDPFRRVELEDESA